MWKDSIDSKMNFTKRPTLLKEEPGLIQQNPVRCNSFEISAGNVTAYRVKLTPDVPSQQAALFRKVMTLAREQLTTKVGNYMVFGTQLVGAQRVQEAHASAEVEGVR
jgi:hypothetical protein